MNISQESIFMLKDKEVEYANDQFLQMFESTLDVMEQVPETHQESVRQKFVNMFKRSKTKS